MDASACSCMPKDLMTVTSGMFLPRKFPRMGPRIIDMVAIIGKFGLPSKWAKLAVHNPSTCLTSQPRHEN